MFNRDLAEHLYVVATNRRATLQTTSRIEVRSRRIWPAFLGMCVLVFNHRPLWAAGEANLLVESLAKGEIRLEARGVRLADALEAIASKGGYFDVEIDDAIERPLVNVNLPASPVEEVVRQVLHGRNYALFFDSEGTLTRVIVLPPSSPPNSSGARPLLKTGRR